MIGLFEGEPQMVHVIAVITAKPGKRDAILKEFRANVPNVLAEQGCVEYVPVVDAEPAPAFQSKLGPDAFMVVEKWQTMEHLKAHATAPHMAAYGAKVKDLIASRVIHLLTPT